MHNLTKSRKRQTHREAALGFLFGLGLNELGFAQPYQSSKHDKMAHLYPSCNLYRSAHTLPPETVICHICKEVQNYV